MPDSWVPGPGGRRTSTSGSMCADTRSARARPRRHKPLSGLRLLHGLRDGCAAPEPAAVAGATPLPGRLACHGGGLGCARHPNPPREVAPDQHSLAGRRNGEPRWVPSRLRSAMPYSPPASRSTNGSSAASKRRSTPFRDGLLAARPERPVRHAEPGGEAERRCRAYGWPGTLVRIAGAPKCASTPRVVSAFQYGSKPWRGLSSSRLQRNRTLCPVPPPCSDGGGRAETSPRQTAPDTPRIAGERFSGLDTGPLGGLAWKAANPVGQKLAYGRILVPSPTATKLPAGRYAEDHADRLVGHDGATLGRGPRDGVRGWSTSPPAAPVAGQKRRGQRGRGPPPASLGDTRGVWPQRVCWLDQITVAQASPCLPPALACRSQPARTPRNASARRARYGQPP